MTNTDLIERLNHCSQNTKDEYLHELTGRAAAALTEANVKLAMAIGALRHIAKTGDAIDCEFARATMAELEDGHD